MDSLVALFWISTPERPWKVFVSNRTRKIAEITEEVSITWKYCPSEENLADLGSRGASIDKLEKGSWSNDPEWLTDSDKWPKQNRTLTHNIINNILYRHGPSSMVVSLKVRDEINWKLVLEIPTI